MNDDEKLIRGEEARRALNNPLIKEALEQIEREAVEHMLECDPKDDETRYRLTVRVKVVREIRDYLTGVRTTAMEVARRQGITLD